MDIVIHLTFFAVSQLITDLTNGGEALCEQGVDLA